MAGFLALFLLHPQVVGEVLFLHPVSRTGANTKLLMALSHVTAPQESADDHGDWTAPKGSGFKPTWSVTEQVCGTQRLNQKRLLPLQQLNHEFQSIDAEEGFLTLLKVPLKQIELKVTRKHPVSSKTSKNSEGLMSHPNPLPSCVCRVRLTTPSDFEKGIEEPRPLLLTAGLRLEAARSITASRDSDASLAERF